MRIFTKLSERELDCVLAGKATGGEFDDVAGFFREMRIGLDETPSPSVEARHLAGIFEEVLHLQSSAPDRQFPRLRGMQRLRNPFRRLAARATIAAIGLAALTAFGGAAYAGALPAPVQGEIAHLARHIGLSLPGINHHSPRPGADNSGTSHTGNTGQPGLGNSGQGTGIHGNRLGNDGQGNDAHGGGAQGNSTQTNRDQGNSTQTNGGRGNGTQGGKGNGDHGAQTNGNQGAQPTTIQSAQNEYGNQVTQNDQSTPNGGSTVAGTDQQGNGTGNSAANGNQSQGG
jgi:hypothetical protein